VVPTYDLMNPTVKLIWSFSQQPLPN